MPAITPSRQRKPRGQPSTTSLKATSRASKATDPEPKLPPAMNQAHNLARARHRLRLQLEHKRRARADAHDCDAAPIQSDRELSRRPALPELMEDDEEERAVAVAESSGPGSTNVGAGISRASVRSPKSSDYPMCLSWEVEGGASPLYPVLLGFKKPASTPDDIAHNIALAKNYSRITSTACPMIPYGHYESEALKLAIAIVLFNNPTAVGVVFPGYTDPCPETAAAYTQMEYSGAAELETRSRKPSLWRPMFAPTHQLRMRQENDYLPEAVPETHESELTEGGRYSKRAKGKGRA
ncbi:hypothetical protein RhiLY_11622 [Ceratobasidium sp. AG-Ba]|nr:hypothetical protein RhiLY_11622 [Ceratobasidium sp. AG-Ba]